MRRPPLVRCEEKDIRIDALAAKGWITAQGRK